MTAASTMLPTPVATISSTRVMAWQRALLGVDVIVQSIMRYQCSHVAVALDVAGLPVDLYHHHLHILGITRRAERRGHVADRHCPLIGGALIDGALIGLRPRRVKRGREGGGNKSRGIDLVQGVERDGFPFFMENLCGPEVLPGHRHDAESLGQDWRRVVKGKG